MSGVQMVDVSAADDDQRLDRWFKQHYPQVRHGQLEKMLRKGQIRVDGGRVKASRRLVAGETIRVPPIEESTGEKSKRVVQKLSAEDADYIRSLVLYEDKHLIALNKPFGLAVQGGMKTTRHIDGMLDAFTQGSGERPRLVHRLDRDTGGLLLLGRTRKAAVALSEAFQRHHVDKTYWALSAGVPHPRAGLIDLPVAKKMVRIKGQDEQERMVAAEGADAKKALTDYQVVEDAGGKASFLALRPLTGRTHQLRVHCAAIECPIVGDGKYGGARARLEGVSAKMHLFCQSMTFPHPSGSGTDMTLTAPLEGHMLKTWRFFNFNENPEIDWPEE